MICRNCGENLQNNNIFCTRCGAPVGQNQNSNVEIHHQMELNENDYIISKDDYLKAQQNNNERDNYVVPANPPVVPQDTTSYQRRDHSGDEEKSNTKVLIIIIICLLCAIAVVGWLLLGTVKNESVPVTSGRTNGTGQEEVTPEENGAESDSEQSGVVTDESGDEGNDAGEENNEPEQEVPAQEESESGDDEQPQEIVWKQMIDVSQYQGNIDWNAVKLDDIEGAMIRCGYRGYGTKGVISADSTFTYNLSNAQKVGLETGVYFHSEATNEEEAVEEAEYVLKSIDGAKLELPVAIVLQYSGDTKRRSNSLSGAERTKIVNAFGNRIKAAGYKAAFYFEISAPADKLIDVNSLTDVKTWIASYCSKEELNYTGDFDMWQYSNAGKINGISGNVDLNYYR